MLHYVTKSLKAVSGLLIFAFGSYLTIQANIGLAPWEVFGMGVSHVTHTTYGTVMVISSILILGVDLLIGERIGLGTLLDALLTGTFVDVFLFWNPLPQQTTLLAGIAFLLPGLVLMQVGSYVFMSCGLCCGPRDSLMVGLGKRLKKLPIGLVKIIIDAAVLLIGWLLGGPVGVGTVVSVCFSGMILQGVFRLFHFEPRTVPQEDIFGTIRAIWPGDQKSA